jgi:homoserine acetyltransferase
MDLMDLGDGADGRRNYSDGAARLARLKSLLVGFRQDALIPEGELQTLAETINRARGGAPDSGDGGGARFVSISSKYGHDAFLLEHDKLSSVVREHLEHGLEAELEREVAANTGSHWS